MLNVVTNIQQKLHAAMQHHQAGRLLQAESLYREILQQQPNHADALHLLGVIAHQSGRNDIATELIRRAIVLNPNDAAYHSNLGIVLHRQGAVEPAIAHFRMAADLFHRSTELEGAADRADLAPLPAELQRLAAHQSKECSLTLIAGEAFSTSAGVRVYLQSLAHAFTGDKYVLVFDITAQREKEIQDGGFIVARVPPVANLLRNRWRLYDAFIAATSYERYLISDSKDVIFQGNPFDYPLAADTAFLAGEGMLHRGSVWNIQDQVGLQRGLSVTVECNNWQIINGGVQYGTRQKMKELSGAMCQTMFGPMVCTDQAALNYIYHTALKNDPGYILALPDAQAFCATGEPIRAGAAMVGYELHWNGKELYGPHVGIYRIVHQWDRTPFAEYILKAHGQL